MHLWGILCIFSDYVTSSKRVNNNPVCCELFSCLFRSEARELTSWAHMYTKRQAKLPTAKNRVGSIHFKCMCRKPAEKNTFRCGGFFAHFSGQLRVCWCGTKRCFSFLLQFSASHKLFRKLCLFRKKYFAVYIYIIFV